MPDVHAVPRVGVLDPVGVPLAVDGAAVARGDDIGGGGGGRGEGGERQGEKGGEGELHDEWLLEGKILELVVLKNMTVLCVDEMDEIEDK